MPAPGPHPRSHNISASTQIDAPERATHKHESSRLAFKGSAMDVLHGAEQESDPISIARCRELLGEDAESMTDQDIEDIRRHAETMACIVVEMYREQCRSSE